MNSSPKTTLPILLLAMTLAGCGGGPAPSSSQQESAIPSSDSQESALSSSSESSVEPSSEESSPFPVGQSIPTEEQPVTLSTDKFRTMYEIMPISFADSDGDKIGDLNGIAEKLDYLKGIHYEGIWCTPICPSPTYHKYDVLDYYDIDSQFGTMGDFDYLIDELHKRGMTFLFDLVINHSAVNHEWFRRSCQAHIAGDTSDPYYEYYNIQERSAGGAWHRVSGSSTLAYEGQFYSGMPDFNLQAVLDNPEGPLATEIKNIMRFWLVDHKIDGFRLDAVTSYFTGDRNKNTQFLTWLNDEAKKLKPDCYIVGEGNWSGNSSENLAYQASGTDSFFNFSNSSRDLNYSIPSIIYKPDGTKFIKNMQTAWSTAGEGVPSCIIANHDIGRLVGAVGGRSDINKAKLGHSMLQLLPGATFNYYGDEVGQAVPVNKAGDPDIRLHVEWGDDYVTKDPDGACSYKMATTYPYPSVAEQLVDEDSLLSHVSRVNRLRQQFPEIARGKAELLDTFEADEKTKIVAFSKETEGSRCIVVLNPSSTLQAVYDFSALGDVTPLAEVAVEGHTTYSGKELYLAPGAIVILK